MDESEAIEILKIMYCPIKSDYEARNLAVKALKKQIPKKVIPTEDGIIVKMCEAEVLTCPNCDNDLMGEYGELEENPLHCCFCGQKLDWSENDG